MIAIAPPDSKGVRQVLDQGKPTGITISEERGLFVVEDKRENHRGSLCRYPDLWAAMEAALTLMGEKPDGGVAVAQRVYGVPDVSPSVSSHTSAPETEEAFQRRVIALAKANGWRVHHVRPARTEKGWRTPIEGDAGFPDLVLARNSSVLFVELKSERGRATEAQRRWAEEIGTRYLLWKPSDWPQIEDWLSGVPPTAEEACDHDYPTRDERCLGCGQVVPPTGGAAHG